MKGLKIIPMFAVLLLLSYVGVIFVRHNPEDVVVRFGNLETPSTALGFVILTSVLVGMIFAGALCSVELMVLYLQNQKMRRKLFPHTPKPTGLIGLTKSLEENLADDVDELIRDSQEPVQDPNSPESRSSSGGS